MWLWHLSKSLIKKNQTNEGYPNLVQLISSADCFENLHTFKVHKSHKSYNVDKTSNWDLKDSKYDLNTRIQYWL